MVLSKNFDDNLTNLDLVLCRLGDHGLKIRHKKCALFRRIVSYLGHLVSKSGIEPSPVNIDAILKYPQPRTVR